MPTFCVHDRELTATSRRCVYALATIVSTLLGAASTAWADVDCGQNPVTVTVTSSLSTNYYTTGSGTCITVTGNNISLDLNGHTITCRNPSSSVCGTAIVGNGSGLILTNSGSGGAGVYGPFWDGIKNFKEIHDCTIGRNSEYGAAPVHGVASGTIHKIDGCVITTDGVAIDGALESNTSRIGDNYIDAIGQTAIVTEGTSSGTGPRVENNYVVNFAYGISGTGSKLRVQDNVLSTISTVGDEFYFDGPASWTLSGNLCQDSTLCPVPAPGWTLP